MEKVEMEYRYKQYDMIVSTIMLNILAERNRNGLYLIYNFDEVNDSHKLYFNIATIAVDIAKEALYLDMSFFKYIKFKFKRRKYRKNLRWFNPLKRKTISEELKTNVDTIMNFVCDELKINQSLFKEINDEYYGWFN